MLDECFGDEPDDEHKPVIAVIKKSFMGVNIYTHIRDFSDNEKMQKKARTAKLSEENEELLVDLSENSIAPALDIIANDLKKAAEQFAANSERIKKGLNLYEPVAK